MVVVADTSPINYLVLIDQIEILPRLYNRILIPPAVLRELKHPVAPKPVRDWSVHPPGWLEVLIPQSSVTVVQLDLGESEAIALAIGMHADVLLIDEQAGRQEAARRRSQVLCRFFMKPKRPGSSISTRRSIACARPVSGFRRRFCPRSKKKRSR